MRRWTAPETRHAAAPEPPVRPNRPELSPREPKQSPTDPSNDPDGGIETTGE